MRCLLLLAAVGALLAAAAPAGAWIWPSDGAVLGAFSFSAAHPYAAGQHRGIDVGGSAGSTVRAPAGGIVTFAGFVPGGGRTLAIETGDGYSVTLVHLGSVDVPRGADIAEGQPVGSVGFSGDAEHAEPYVHLGIRVASQPEGYVDPLGLLPPRATPPPPPEVEPIVPAPVPVKPPVGGGVPGRQFGGIRRRR